MSCMLSNVQNIMWLVAQYTSSMHVYACVSSAQVYMYVLSTNTEMQIRVHDKDQDT